MKSFRQELWFEVPARRGFVNITPEVERCLRASGISEGLVLVNAMHITASVFINDDESGLHHDYEVWLRKNRSARTHGAVPPQRRRGQRGRPHEAAGDGPRGGRGRHGGRLDFGPWEQIFYGEFDGRRRKRALVKIIGE